MGNPYTRRFASRTILPAAKRDTRAKKFAAISTGARKTSHCGHVSSSPIIRFVAPYYQNERTVFHGRRIEVKVVEVPTSSGSVAQRDLVVHPGAVVILPVAADGSFVFIRNRRFAVGKELWELPAGTLEPPEEPSACAARELIEETGYEAGKLTPLGEFYSSPGFCNELLHAFVAEDLRHVGQQLEDDEEIRVELLPPERVRQMMRLGEINDAKTLATLGLYFLGEGA